METDVSQIIFVVVFPIFLSFIQLIVPQDTKPKYLVLGFVGLSIAGILGYYYCRGAFSFGTHVLIALAGAPMIFALVRFVIIPGLQRIKQLHELQEVLGAAEWGRRRSHNIDTYEALNSVESSFKFMGFGFSKYLKATKDQRKSDEIPEVEESLLWDKLRDISAKSPTRAVKILLMNPLADEIDEYSDIFDDEKYPMAEDLYFGLDGLREIRDAFRDRVQVKFYPHSRTYKPSFRLFFANESDLYVSFYKWGTGAKDLPYLHIREGESNFFHPFQVLFDYFWEHGEVADIDNIPFTITLRDLYSGNRDTLDRLHRYIREQLPVHLRDVSFDNLRIAVAAIAGRDSAAAILKSVEEGHYHCVVPVSIGAPCEYLAEVDSAKEGQHLGDYRIRSRTVKQLKQATERIRQGAKHDCLVLNLVNIAAGAQPWGDLMKKTQETWHLEAGDQSIDEALNQPCIWCHVYIHYLRAMFCNRMGFYTMISGDREYHDDRVKLNQTAPVLDSISELVERDFSVDFTLPVRDVRETKRLQRQLEAYGITRIDDVDCFFGGLGTVSTREYEAKADDIAVEVNKKLNQQLIPLLRKTLEGYRRV